LTERRRHARWIAYIDAISWAPGELDHQEFSASLKAAFYNIDPQIALNHVLDRMKRRAQRICAKAKFAIPFPGHTLKRRRRKKRSALKTAIC
jgi:hypothetical protein